MTPRDDARAACTAASGSTGAASATFRFAGTLPVFAGHFPGAPLVPGVHVIACVVEASARALGAAVTVRAIERAKWSAPVRPDEELHAEVALTADGDGWRADGTVRGPAGVCATCRLRLGAVA